MPTIKKESFDTYLNTAAEKAAFTNALPGDKYFETDTGLTYVYTGAAWVKDAGAVALSGSNLPLVAGTAFIGKIGVTTGSGDLIADSYAMPDGQSANVRALATAAFQEMYNGTTYDKLRGNVASSLLASAARTTTISTADQINHNSRGVRVTINVTSIANSPSVVPMIEVKDSVSGVYTAILTGAAITGAGTTVLRIYPGITAAANLAVSDILSRTWRVTMTHADADSITYSVGCDLML